MGLGGVAIAVLPSVVYPPPNSRSRTGWGVESKSRQKKQEKK